jgi:hypothetical protein
MLVLFGVLGGVHIMDGSPPAPTDKAWSNAGFTADRVAQLATMAKRAYHTLADDTEFGDYRLIAHHHVPFTLSLDMWHDPGARDVVVAFSGTPGGCVRSVVKSLALVWKPPVRIVESVARPAPLVDMCTHRYVLTGLRLLLAQFREGEGTELAELLAAFRAGGTNVTFTGHSRGGVAAMLMAHYEMSFVDDVDHAVLAVSAPPTFCAGTVARLEGSGRGRASLSVAAHGDPVTGLQHAPADNSADPLVSLKLLKSADPDHMCSPEFRHLGIFAEFRDGEGGRDLVAVTHACRTNLAGSSLDLDPHAIDGIVADAQCLARSG